MKTLLTLLCLALAAGAQTALGQSGEANIGIEHCRKIRVGCNTCTYCDGSDIGMCTLVNCPSEGLNLLPELEGPIRQPTQRPRLADLMPIVEPLPPTPASGWLRNSVPVEPLHLYPVRKECWITPWSGTTEGSFDGTQHVTITCNELLL